MPNINDSFPSKYLKASDLDGENLTVTISHVTIEEVGKDRDVRPILYYEGEEKGIVLNKTNATNIAKLYGNETDDWPGKRVMLGTTYVDFQGQSVEAIRVYPPRRQAPNAPLTKGGNPVVEEGQRPFAPDVNDEIPF